ncbi:hypothetical protein EPO15_13425 [bacterium]|nr:MAG: hypothetical protein EPO15_13425 [bacterium]
MRNSLLLLAVLLAAPARAEQSELFDGTSGKKLEFPAVTFTPSPAPKDVDPRPAQTKQSGSDLFYFSPEEAAAAKKKFGVAAFRDPAGELPFDKDVPKEIQAQMLGDLAFIKTVSGSGASPLHRQIFGAVDGSVYEQFFKSRVSGVGMSRCGDGNAVACVMPFWNPTKMWLTQNYIRFSHPQVSRLMVVFHEARHTESGHGNWGHASCPTPFLGPDGKEMRSIWTGAELAGEAACDKTPLGSYGSSAIMLKNIANHCETCNGKVRQDASLYADDQLGRVTDAKAHQQMVEDFKL